MKHSFNNIITPVFHSTESESVEERILVAINLNGKFAIDLFTLTQLVKGTRLWLANQWGVENVETVPIHDVRLIADLNEQLFHLLTEANKMPTDETDLVTTSTVELTLDRADVIKIRSFLEARMTHCEYERDARNKEFNADTYISMKLLLIEIREWLLGDIIESKQS